MAAAHPVGGLGVSSWKTSRAILMCKLCRTTKFGPRNPYLMLVFTLHTSIMPKSKMAALNWTKELCNPNFYTKWAILMCDACKTTNLGLRNSYLSSHFTSCAPIMLKFKMAATLSPGRGSYRTSLSTNLAILICELSLYWPNNAFEKQNIDGRRTLNS